MTDATRDHDSQFAEGRKPPGKTSDGRRRDSRSSGRADRTPAGTAEPTRTAGDRTAGDRPDRTAEDRPDRTNRREETDVGPHAVQTESGETPLAGKSRVQATDSDESPDGADTEPKAPPDHGPSGDRVEERLRAVERALTGTDDAVADIGDEAAANAEREALSTRLDDLESRVEEVEAATQAIRGYVGSIRSVNQAVERRADLALARASEDGGGTTTEGETTPDHDATDDVLDSGVPSESALDAAVPTEQHAEGRAGGAAESAVESTVDRPETDDNKAEDSWRTGALDRLRESL